jgi:outer membrane protein assembly factor BamA
MVSVSFGFFPLYKDFDVRLFQAFERPTFDEELTRMGGELSLTYPLTSTIDLTMGGRHENFEECLRDGLECKPPGITDSVKFGVINDTRDNPLFPMEGGRRTLQIEKAGGFSVGVEFTKLEAAVVHHFFTFENQNISIRMFAGWGDSLPSQEKFAFGGPGSLRGGLTSRVSWLAFSNIEYRTKWLDQFSTALFTDWGMTEKDDFTGTAGLEARVSLPIVGMTRFILAWPINDPSYKTFVPRFQFSFGTMF